MPTMPASAWWPGLRPTIAWCWNNDRAPPLRRPRPLRRDRAVSVDDPVLPGAVRLRPQDCDVAHRGRAAAVYPGVRPLGGARGNQGGARAIIVGQFPAPDLGQHLHPVL